LLNVSYGQPAFLLGLGWFKVGVRTRDYRDQFYEFGLTADYTTRLSTQLNAGAVLGWKRVDPSSGIGGYRTLSAGFAFTRQALDNRFNPSRGLNVSASLTYDYRSYRADSLIRTGSTSYNETRSHLALTSFTHIAGPLVNCVSINYSGFETREQLPPISELILIGGPGTLRGSRSEQFAARRVAYGTVEPHYRFNSGYLFAFYDAAYLDSPQTDAAAGARSVQEYRYGFGGGWALTSGKRSIRLSLAWNPTVAMDQPWLSIEFSSDL
jgi:hemolysin activation/secretion protein